MPLLAAANASHWSINPRFASSLASITASSSTHENAPTAPPTTLISPESTPPSQLPNGVAVGITLASVALLSIVMGIVWFWKRRRQQAARDLEADVQAEKRPLQAPIPPNSVVLSFMPMGYPLSSSRIHGDCMRSEGRKKLSVVRICRPKGTSGSTSWDNSILAELQY